MAEPRPEGLAHLLACPDCMGELAGVEGSLRCRSCGAVYRIVDRIPMFADEAAAAHDELDCHADEGRHVGNGDHKARQAAWFDRTQQAEFEIERPTGAPALYRFLLLEKFRRAMKPLGTRLDGCTALAVCGGSGMDAEFLATIGASAISSDISIGAAKRAQERGRRHNVPITSIVADVERLPFRDRSIDLVYVHDGLHHLDDPKRGLREMARVARRWVAITEPANAAATRLAVRLGLALEHEESGNLVARLDSAAVGSELRAAGFEVIQSQRYAMYYRHFPGRVFAALSHPGVYELATTGWRIANAVTGRLGNKLSVVAERRDASVS